MVVTIESRTSIYHRYYLAAIMAKIHNQEPYSQLMNNVLSSAEIQLFTFKCLISMFKVLINNLL